MTVWQLHRDTRLPGGVLGQLTGAGGVVYQTLENPEFIIPAGEYEVRRDYYHTGRAEAFEIQVPGRDRILLHWGNFASQSRGCPLLGRTRGWADEAPAVWRSREAFDDFMSRLDSEDVFTLVVTE